MSPKNRQFLGWLWQQFQLQQGKPAYIYGLRTLLVLGAPIAVGFLLGKPTASAIATISALFVGMVNINGTYRQQALAIGTATVGITLALLIANLVSSNFWLTIATTFTVIFVLGLAGLYDAAAARVSLVISMMFIISLARFSSFPNLVTILEQCLLCLAGGLWTMVLSLSLWIVRPYKPVIQSVADCYLALSKLTQLAQNRVTNLQQEDTNFLQTQDAAIQNIIFARDMWTSVWTKEKTDNPRGERLLVLLEDANQIANSLVALAELIAIASQKSLFALLQPEIERGTEQIVVSLQRLSTALKKERSIPLNRIYFENRSFSSSGSRCFLTHKRSLKNSGVVLIRC
ncbi:FUSC family membrane protein [Myxosarcina sp. GI1]|uniref:FUSC family membrane protein n=1 Tax=Myxosarcina sp. GI1 TaxID=1541065 RepID=UPI0006906D49|nr:FUSC family membrane protein [Myxosarcina sp. GI1]